MNLSHFWGESAAHGIKPGAQVGLLLEYKFNPNFAIAPEVVFSMQGAKFNKNSVKADYNFNYINVPVMLKFYVCPEFSIDFGPQIGFRVYSKIKVKEPVAYAAEDVKDFTNVVDFGLGLGGTYNITPNLFVQARYNLGLTKVFKDDELREFLQLAANKESTAKNGNIQLAIGYKF